MPYITNMPSFNKRVKPENQWILINKYVCLEAGGLIWTF
jgi:hypothetical protein